MSQQEKFGKKPLGYVIRGYSRFREWDRQHKRYAFLVNGQWYAIFDIDDGLPVSVEYDEDLNQYKVYKSFEAAMEYARTMVRLN